MNTSKLNYLLVFVLVALFGFSATAQDYTFKVISKKGTATVGGEELKVGSKIQAGQSITVGASTLLNIAHKNGKSLNISKAGNYKADDLAKGCLVASGSLAGKYADFVLKELTSSDDGGVRGKNMRKPGSVVRDAETVSLLFANNSEKKSPIAPASITLKCYPNDTDKAKVKLTEADVTKYTFVITDLMGTELASIDSEKPQVSIDMSEDRFASAPGGAIQYYAYANGDKSLKSKEFALQLVSGDQAKEISQNITELSADESAVGKLILARFFEEHGMHANAIYAYEKALELSNQDAQYESMYQAFLDRNYLSKQKKTAN